MPQVDLETLVSACAGGADRKIACETLAEMEQEPRVCPDSPPESFWLSKDAELDWFDRNAFLERKESQKGNNSNSMNLNPNIVPGSNSNSNSNSNSQRFSKNLKAKAAIIGLPKTQKNMMVKNCRVGAANHKVRLFPKKPARSGEGPLIEPSSPKVSCMGRVRSKKDRKRRTTTTSEPPLHTRRPGFFATFRAIFRTGCKEKPTHSPPPTPPTRAAREHDALPPRRSVDADPPGLGGLHRFASGRRSNSLVEDLA